MERLLAIETRAKGIVEHFGLRTSGRTRSEILSALDILAQNGNLTPTPSEIRWTIEEHFPAEHSWSQLLIPDFWGAMKRLEKDGLVTHQPITVTREDGRTFNALGYSKAQVQTETTTR